MLIDMRIDMCTDMCMNMCVDVRIDVRMDMCTDMYIDVYSENNELLRRFKKRGAVDFALFNAEADTSINLRTSQASLAANAIYRHRRWPYIGIAAWQGQCMGRDGPKLGWNFL